MSDDNTSVNKEVDNLTTPLIDNETITINNIADIVNSTTDSSLDHIIKVEPITNRTPIVKPNNDLTRIPSIINSISNIKNSINSLASMNNNDAKIEIADNEHLQNVNLEQLIKNLQEGSKAVTPHHTLTSLSPVKEGSITGSQIGKSEYQKIKQQIIADVVVPNFLKDIKGTVNSRGKWRNAGNKAELFSKILTGAATIVAFAAGAYTDYTYLSFIAGCIGTGAMVCQQFSTYAKGESKERTEQANKILKVLNIDSIPEIDDEN